MDASTIAVICVLAVIMVTPVVLYVSMMSRWLCDSTTRFWLRLPMARDLVKLPQSTSSSQGQQAEVGGRPQLAQLRSSFFLPPREMDDDDDEEEEEGDANDDNNTKPQQSSTYQQQRRRRRREARKPPPPVLLTYEDVRFSVMDPKTKQTKEILKGVTGYFSPGSFSAVIGSSGCGKTTLLSILADHIQTVPNRMTVTGKVLVNGHEKNDSFRRVAAYVMQSDQLMESLTVRETLWFAAELRLSETLNRGDKFGIIETLLRDLDLKKVADVNTGKLSGGTKRRVTVAIELVARPSLIFLDEPTSGLDAGATLSLVSVLRRLADQGRTIVCTIHQPRADAFAQFDRVVLMHSGRVIYFGTVGGILPHFKSLDKGTTNAPPHDGATALALADGVPTSHPAQEEDEEEVNPADFLLDLTHDVGKMSGGRDLVKEYDTSPLRGEVEQAMRSLIPPPPVGLVGEAAEREAAARRREEAAQAKQPIHMRSWRCTRQSLVYASTTWKQSFTLTRRAFVNDVRSNAYLMQWFLGIVMNLFMGILYIYVSSPSLNSVQIQELDGNLTSWGACTQNVTSLGEILGLNATAANATLWQCGEQLDTNSALTYARISFLYQMAAGAFFSEMPQVAAVFVDRLLFAREHASRSYSSNAWVYSWVTRLSFAALLKGLVFPPFAYFLAQLPIDPQPYFLYCIFTGTMSLAGGSIALLVATGFQSFEAASVAFVVVNVVTQNLCGYFVSQSYIPWYFRWFYFANFFRYTFEGLVISQELTNANAAIISSSDFDNMQRIAWQYAIIAILYCVIIQLIALFVAQIRGKTPRQLQQVADSFTGCFRRAAPESSSSPENVEEEAARARELREIASSETRKKQLRAGTTASTFIMSSAGAGGHVG